VKLSCIKKEKKTPDKNQTINALRLSHRAPDMVCLSSCLDEKIRPGEDWKDRALSTLKALEESEAFVPVFRE
jgi:hypothetical protein